MGFAFVLKRHSPVMKLLIFAVRPPSIKLLFLPGWCEFSVRTRVASLAKALSRERGLVLMKLHNRTLLPTQAGLKDVSAVIRYFG